jgi:hypothetical protein
MSVAVPFPEVQPDGYEWLGDEPAADQLEETITDVQQAIRDLRTDPPPMEHYEHGVE